VDCNEAKVCKCKRTQVWEVEMSSLKGKAAIITGAAKGIGLGVARVFAGEGAQVVIVDLDEVAGQEAIRDLRVENQNALFVKADVSKVEDIRFAVNRAVESLGSINVLVNNAGTHNGKGIEDCSEEDWDLLLDTNLRSAFLFTKYALPYLKKAQGSVINIASMVGLVGQGKSVAYSASKGGMIAMTKSLALDVAPYGIRVNAICPGFVHTPLLDKWFDGQADPAAVRQRASELHPLGRIAEPEEIGRVALFLATEESSFITGVALPVEGGVTLGY
jgi:NAD(P)-dependent dehydrogenase (short-subunit alcohol dehydrogenase family)